MARGAMHTRIDPGGQPRPSVRVLLRRMLQRGALVLFGVLAAILLIEVGLQIAALWTWRHAERRHPVALQAPKANNQRRVLCVGDSFT